MKFGVFDHLDRGQVSIQDHFENRLKLAEIYDRAGFYAYHIAEHHGTPLGMASSPSVFLAAVAQRTKKLRFGPLVYTLSLTHPIRIIEEVCMLDQMSGGRLELGIGRGSSPYEMGYFGVNAENSGKLYIESFDVVMMGLKERLINFEGEHFNFKNVPIELECVQKPTPPIWYGMSQPTLCLGPLKTESTLFAMDLAPQSRPSQTATGRSGPSKILISKRCQRWAWVGTL